MHQHGHQFHRPARPLNRYNRSIEVYSHSRELQSCTSMGISSTGQLALLAGTTVLLWRLLWLRRVHYCATFDCLLVLYYSVHRKFTLDKMPQRWNENIFTLFSFLLKILLNPVLANFPEVVPYRICLPQEEKYLSLFPPLWRYKIVKSELEL